MTGTTAQVGNATLRLMVGNIVTVPVDAMANAANGALRGGGGVDGAIHAAGGPTLMQELDLMRSKTPLSAGSVVATGAGRLPARFVFHAVGPIWRGGGSGEPEALASCYRTCLLMAEERECRSISFPSISTGIYGYPVHLAAPLALKEVIGFLRDRAAHIIEVTFVLFDQGTYDVYAASLGQALAE